MSKYDESTQNFSHIVNIQNRDAFTLKPLVLTEGFFEGCRALVLQPITSAFRILDTPAEIRTMIYSFLLEEDSPIKMTTTKPDLEPRRPTRSTYSTLNAYRRTALALLRVNKQIRNEATPVMYGNNHFHFRTLSELKVFLDSVGSMRQYLRNIEFGEESYVKSRARPVSNSLRDAINLQSLTFHHADVCKEDGPQRYSAASPTQFVSDSKGLFKSLHKVPRDPTLPYNVLDLLKIKFTKCYRCRREHPENHPYDQGCSATWRSASCTVLCKDADAHCKEVEAKLRGMVAKELGIEEQ